MQDILVFVLYFYIWKGSQSWGIIKLSKEKVSNEEERLLSTLVSPDLCAGFFSLLSTTATLGMVTEIRLFPEA